MQNENQQTTVQEYISLRDIVDFLNRNKWLILFCGVVGLLASKIYLMQVPEKYEARWQMQMASGSEEPVTLIQRLRVPSVYPVEIQLNCGMPEGGEFGDYLGGTLKVDPIKGLANAVEMKLGAPSYDQVKKCAEGIVAMITLQQRGLIEERFVGRKELVTHYQKEMLDELQQLERIKKSDISNVSYLAKLDKLSLLRTRIASFQEEIYLSQLNPTKLIAPIYIPKNPVARKVILLMMLGVAFGMMLGVLYALGRDTWRKTGFGV